jgi:carboxyl-terminal processing protease
MKSVLWPHTKFALLAVGAAFIIHPEAARAETDPGQVAVQVARVLEQGHYTRQKLNDEMSQKLLDTYIEGTQGLDYNKLYFLQSDIDEFQKKYGTTLDDSIAVGDLEPAREIFNRFKERVTDRVAKNKKLATQKFDFTTEKTIEFDRRKAPWPKDMADADRIWHDIVEAELLKEKLNKLKTKTPQETVAKRYDQLLRNLNEADDEEVVKRFLSALAQSYDPHSEYLSDSDLKNFQVTMGLSLEGVGAVLRSDEGYAKVVEVVPGGPADKDGRLKVNDRIAAVAQGKGGEFEDVVDMKLDKVVAKIRGDKGSVVRLTVLPANATDPSERKIIDLKRDKVELKEQAAKAEVIDWHDADGKVRRIGWITLPAFYATMGGSQEHKSTTEDVAALLGRLKKENIEGLIMDLRQDGGGSLDEAINLTGLFINQGPVVQAKDTTGKMTRYQDPDPAIQYDGPMVVLMNRLSASASEIFAAALQDYGRAVIVGDQQSFGKGTVQTVMELGRPSLPFLNMGPSDAGALKFTIQKFYRIRGGSTQFNGVKSDIVLPSLFDVPEFGEGSLNNALAYDEVAPLKFSEFGQKSGLFIDELNNRSAQRVAQDPEFKYIMEDVQRRKELVDKNTISLNEKSRRKELDDDKKRKETRQAERTSRGPIVNAKDYQLTLDDVTAEKLKEVPFIQKKSSRYYDEDADDENGDKDKEADAPVPDPVRNEALRIMDDLIGLQTQTRTASIHSEPAQANTPAVRD